MVFAMATDLVILLAMTLSGFLGGSLTMVAESVRAWLAHALDWFTLVLLRRVHRGQIADNEHILVAGDGQVGLDEHPSSPVQRHAEGAGEGGGGNAGSPDHGMCRDGPIADAHLVLRHLGHDGVGHDLHAEADELLSTRKLTKKQRQARRDQLAAQIMLTAYLESGGRSQPSPESVD